MRLYLFLFLALCGCGKGPNNIDPAFRSYYDQFIDQANQAGLNLDKNQAITIQFAMLEQKDSLGEVVGECNSVGYGYDTISIDTDFWNSSNAATRLVLVEHELGHCILDEGHSNDPDAIMYPIVNYPAAYYNSQDWSGMLSQLFKDSGNYPTNVP